MAKGMQIDNKDALKLTWESMKRLSAAREERLRRLSNKRESAIYSERPPQNSPVSQA